MISSDEIEQKSKEFKISPKNVQRDYVFGWLLTGIYRNDNLKNRLILKGGNALRKGYLPATRFSKDLDFSIREAVDPTDLHDKVNSVLQFVQDNSGVRFFPEKTVFKPKLVIDDKQVFEGKAVFQGFYEEEEATLKLQMDITEFEKIILPVQDRPLIHPYSDTSVCQAVLKCHKLEEVLASKLVGLLHRRKVGDLFDLAYTIFRNNHYQVNRGEVITTFLKKTIYQTQPKIVQQQLLELPIDESRPFWSEIIAPFTSLFGFDDAVSNFKEMINVLFGLLPTQVAFAPSGYGFPSQRRNIGGYFSGISYYPTDYRSKIVTAGQNQTLIRLLYHGYWRDVEPYALKYKVRKKDNRGIEYFYGFDRTGGESGNISIKSFFSEDIENIQLTSVPFAPQYPIEL